MDPQFPPPLPPGPPPSSSNNNNSNNGVVPPPPPPRKAPPHLHHPQHQPPHLHSTVGALPLDHPPPPPPRPPPHVNPQFTHALPPHLMQHHIPVPPHLQYMNQPIPPQYGMHTQVPDVLPPGVEPPTSETFQQELPQEQQAYQEDYSGEIPQPSEEEYLQQGLPPPEQQTEADPEAEPEVDYQPHRFEQPLYTLLKDDVEYKPYVKKKATSPPPSNDDDIRPSASLSSFSGSSAYDNYDNTHATASETHYSGYPQSVGDHHLPPHLQSNDSNIKPTSNLPPKRHLPTREEAFEMIGTYENHHQTYNYQRESSGGMGVTGYKRKTFSIEETREKIKAAQAKSATAASVTSIVVSNIREKLAARGKATKGQVRILNRDQDLLNSIAMPTYVAHRTGAGLTAEEIQKAQEEHTRKLVGWKYHNAVKAREEQNMQKRKKT